MKFPGVLFLVLTGVHLMIGPLFAQQSTPERVHLVALMVEFQPDDNRFTSGNGTFEAGAIPYLESPGTNIDALPHDQGYFEAHLEFSKRYFERQAKGKLTLSYEVLPRIIRLPREMAGYSPVGENPENIPLAELARDAWMELANHSDLVQRVSIALQTYDSVGFVIFHAGIGRDLELIGTVLEKTPQDIPSVYLDQQALSQLLVNPGFDGFDVGGGARITNSMIVPRTQSRVGQDISGETFVVGLSVNGMLTAQIGSFLGLPDLFQTQTGESGIGRFGLMDGAGIFAMNGLFPPELSAWEKVWLGWEDPLEVDPVQLQNEEEVQLVIPAAALRQNGSIIKIPVTDSEYFLIENRHRDLDGNGSTWTFQRADGELETLQVTNLDTDILEMSLRIDSLFPKGVLIDVSNYDFALHGGADTGEEFRDPLPSDRQLNGGILIWHIDEGVIRSALSDRDQGVNDDPERRGVDLEEADGAQDIGYATSLGFSSIDPTGGAFDFWWSGNDARVITQTGEIQLYQNQFSSSTKPDNKSYGGGQSWFSLFDFSENIPVASVRLRAERSVMAGDMSVVDMQKRFSSQIDDQFGHLKTPPESSSWPLPIWFTPSGNPAAGISGIEKSSTGNFTAGKQAQEDGYLLLAGKKALWAVSVSSDGEAPAPSPVMIDEGMAGAILATGDRVLVSYPDEKLIVSYLYQIENGQLSHRKDLNGQQSNGLFQKEWTTIVPETGGQLRTPRPGILKADFAGWELDVNTGEILSQAGNINLQTPVLHGVSATLSGNVLSVSANGVSTTLPLPASINDAFRTGKRVELGILETESEQSTIYFAGGSYLFRVTAPYSGMDLLELTPKAAEIPSAFADINADGRLDILYVSEDSLTLYAIGVHGASLPHFPISAPPGTRFAGSPLLMNLQDETGLQPDGNASEVASVLPEIVIPISGNGSVTLVSYDASGALLTSPKLAIGSATAVYLDQHRLATISPDGFFQLFEFLKPAEVMWASPLGETPEIGLKASLNGTETPINPFTLLNKDEVYNWPNPASDITRIRFETAHGASLTIRVITPSGRKFYEKSFQARGGAPEEVEIDVSSWPSGLYVVQVTASDSDRTERKQFNMAVIH